MSCSFVSGTTIRALTNKLQNNSLSPAPSSPPGAESMSNPLPPSALPPSALPPSALPPSALPPSALSASSSAVVMGHQLAKTRHHSDPARSKEALHGRKCRVIKFSMVDGSTAQSPLPTDNMLTAEDSVSKSGDCEEEEEEEEDREMVRIRRKAALLNLQDDQCPRQLQTQCFQRCRYPTTHSVLSASTSCGTGLNTSSPASSLSTPSEDTTASFMCTPPTKRQRRSQSNPQPSTLCQWLSDTRGPLCRPVPVRPFSSTSSSSSSSLGNHHHHQQQRPVHHYQLSPQHHQPLRRAVAMPQSTVTMSPAPGLSPTSPAASALLSSTLSLSLSSPPPSPLPQRPWSSASSGFYDWSISSVTGWAINGVISLGNGGVGGVSPPTLASMTMPQANPGNTGSCSCGGGTGETARSNKSDGEVSACNDCYIMRGEGGRSGSFDGGQGGIGRERRLTAQRVKSAKSLPSVNASCNPGSPRRAGRPWTVGKSRAGRDAGGVGDSAVTGNLLRCQSQPCVLHERKAGVKRRREPLAGEEDRPCLNFGKMTETAYDCLSPGPVPVSQQLWADSSIGYGRARTSPMSIKSKLTHFVHEQQMGFTSALQTIASSPQGSTTPPLPPHSPSLQLSTPLASIQRHTGAPWGTRPNLTALWDSERLTGRGDSNSNSAGFPFDPTSSSRLRPSVPADSMTSLQAPSTPLSAAMMDSGCSSNGEQADFGDNDDDSDGCDNEDDMSTLRPSHTDCGSPVTGSFSGGVKFFSSGRMEARAHNDSCTGSSQATLVEEYDTVVPLRCGLKDGNGLCGKICGGDNDGDDGDEEEERADVLFPLEGLDLEEMEKY